MSIAEKLLAALGKSTNTTLVTGILRGIEKENLRIVPEGRLACSPHPTALGSALTHPQITTDYSEALLEFITPPSHRVEDVLGHLENIHRFTYQQLNNEYLWVTSMPCALDSDADIPVARYGSSNVGQMKTIYRLGLGHRYGRLMQTIAGIHYNFSLPNAFWAFLHNFENSCLDLQAFKTQRYFDLIRNFRRYYWLLIYLYGAAPVVCDSFVKNRRHYLQPFGDDGNSMHAPFATSLRMGDLGYQSAAQETLVVCYNNLKTYLETLCRAITEPHQAYQAIGLTGENGDFQQLNTSLLQIENEFYSSIRPKRTAYSAETALGALYHRGVEYIEVRCVDLNPYEPLGINAEQIHFMDTFLLYCLLQESKFTDDEEYRNIQKNQKSIVYRGRDPALRLINGAGEQSVEGWGNSILGELEPVAQLLDNAYQTQVHSKSLSLQYAKLADPELTPSARILHEMKGQGMSFFEFGMHQALKHGEVFMNATLNTEIESRFKQMSATSFAEQRQMEAADKLTFAQYLDHYYTQYRHCGCD